MPISLATLQDRARQQRQSILAPLDAYAIQQFGRYADAVRRGLQNAHYKDVSQVRFTWPAETTDQHRALCNRALTLLWVEQFEFAQSRFALPRSVQSRYLLELQRIVEQVCQLPDSIYDLHHDSLRKDLAILNHRLIPVGAVVLETDTVIPKSDLMHEGLWKALANWWWVMFRARGFRPYFLTHTHNLSLDELTPDGWALTYQRMAELLALNPTVKGWIGGSWLVDPQLQTISPRHTPISGYAQQAGGRLLFLYEDTKGTSGALTRSKTRQRLFAEGRYIPRVYLRILPRRRVLAWHSNRHQNTGNH